MTESYVEEHMKYTNIQISRYTYIYSTIIDMHRYVLVNLTYVSLKTTKRNREEEEAIVNVM